MRIKAQDIRTGADQEITNGAILTSVAECMVFFGSNHVGHWARLSGPGIDTEKESITPHDQNVPDYPFNLQPGSYTIEVWLENQLDETINFEVK